MFKGKILFICLLTILSVNTQAKTLVLIHGFMSSGDSWRSSGFTRPLQRAGYKDGGNYSFNQWGVLLPKAVSETSNVFFTLDLPSKQNIQNQESILRKYLQYIYLQRKEPLTLLGHSAGGLVARLYLIDPESKPANGLITIASPHLGTPAANVAYLAGNSPIGMMASMIGGEELQDSRGLFSDLKDEKRNNFLYWLNRQVYPAIHYASVIRQNKVAAPNKYDFVVPAKSQNMNNVWSLRGRSGVFQSKSNHSIDATDGLITLEILKHIN